MPGKRFNNHTTWVFIIGLLLALGMALACANEGDSQSYGSGDDDDDDDNDNDNDDAADPGDYPYSDGRAPFWTPPVADDEIVTGSCGPAPPPSDPAASGDEPPLGGGPLHNGYAAGEKVPDFVLTLISSSPAPAGSEPSWAIQ